MAGTNKLSDKKLKALLGVKRDSLAMIAGCWLLVAGCWLLVAGC
ncbi:hypothetical protein [Photorhabdus bodei]|nr:hypothetical protein [Photorhabdus bodei]